MGNSNQLLPVIPLPGLRLEVLGDYLASLGLVRLLACNWPEVRIAWRDGVLQVVGGPANLDELLDWLVDIAQKQAWTPYDRGWSNEQKKSTKEKTGRPLSLWQASAAEATLELFAAHAVPRERVAFNPLLGSGGNAGRREFARGWKAAVDALARPKEGVDRRRELRYWLTAQPVTWTLSDVAAGSWFSAANKQYSSGQSAYREEPLSPWAMVLACEGLPFFAGAASRRLGARARAQGAFPFVCQAAAPATAGEAGRDRGEVWAPIWERPMTVPEVRALFQRGRAEVHGRGATTPAAFAAAIVQRGVDAGITGFARFALGATTSANTFEPRHQGMIVVHHGARDQAAARARSDTVQRILALAERLPADRKVGRRWRFVGLRAPIETALVRVAQAPDDAGALCQLLDAVVVALDRVDRNVGHRKTRVRWQPLPLEGLRPFFGNADPGIEARLAGALVSAFPESRPFTLYRFGVKYEDKFGRFEHPETSPFRWVFRPGPLPRVLADVLLRATLDREKEKKPDSAAATLVRRLPLTVAASDVQHWLTAHVDEELLARWLGRFALFDWRRIPKELQRLWRTKPDGAQFADGPLLLAGLFQPLFDTRPLRLTATSERDDMLSEDSGARAPGATRVLAALIRTRQVDSAVRMARSRYAIAAVPLMRTEPEWDVVDSDRLLAGLLFPIADLDRQALVERWLRPQRMKGQYAYV